MLNKLLFSYFKISRRKKDERPRYNEILFDCLLGSRLFEQKNKKLNNHLMSKSLFNCSTALIYSSSSLPSRISFDCVAPIIQSTVLCLTRISSVSISLFRFSSSYSIIYMASLVLSVSLSIQSNIQNKGKKKKRQREEENLEFDCLNLFS